MRCTDNGRTTPKVSPANKENPHFYNSGLRLEGQRITSAAINILQKRFSVIPADPATKKPTISWTTFQKAPMSPDAASRLQWPGVAIITGKVSGNAEALDFDYKAAWFGPWAEIVEAEAPGLVARLTRQGTQSAGKHGTYRCPGVAIPGNTKLASDKIEVDGPGEHDFQGKAHKAHQEGDRFYIYPCYIETRGEGGYFLAAPTPGYALENGDFLGLPEITPAERGILIRAAQALNRYVKPKYHKQPTVDGTRPGDHYNRDADPRQLLEIHGWTPAGSKGDFEHWIRPGKDRGISASLIDGKLFHVFTTNAPPLEQWTVYTPFILYATLEHNGDFEAAARELRRQGYGGSGSGRNRPVDHKPDESSGQKKTWVYARRDFPRTTYPWEILPEEITKSLRKLARSCATEADQLPGMVCAMIGGALGRIVGISPKIGWNEPVIIWTIDIRATGEGKSPVMQALARVLKRVQKEEHARYDKEYKKWAAVPPKERGEPPDPPRGYYCTDLTLEGLRSDLEGHPTGGIVALLNEASVLINGQNQYKQKGTDREAWLKLHDGDDARIVRAAKSLLISGARVQVVGGIQPAIFRQVFGGNEGQYIEDGTVYRCLFVYSPSRHHELTNEGWSDEHRRAWDRTLQRALEWANHQEGEHIIKLTGEAQQAFLTWRNTLDREKVNLPPELRGFLPKAYGYALRLAAAIDCIHQFHAGKAPRNLLDVEGIERGIKAAMYYLGQAVDAMRLIMGDEMTVDPVKARILEALKDREAMTATEIYTDVFQKNKPSQKINEALCGLVDDEQVTATTEPTEGRPKTTYALNVKNVFTYKASTAESEQDPTPELNAFNTLNTYGDENENDDDEVEI